MSERPAPFDLLRELFGDDEMIEIFSARRTVGAWMEVEAALARAQGRLGVIASDRAEAIDAACADVESIDFGQLWKDARNVGYPILGLVRQLDAALPEPLRGSVHLGATTQDIMDSGLALQLDTAMSVAERRLSEFGSALAAQLPEHAMTVMPGRTHGQQAVPTTLGAKLAVYVDELVRHRGRLLDVRDDVRRVSLFGAGGTSAALGARAQEIRTLVAEQLGLVDETIPWHVARDSIVHVAGVLVAAATTAARLAREITDLSRTEIGEISEVDGHLRGASSTMPQKANPISSESIVGFAVAARSSLTGLSRAAEAGHERSAGEWQVEWALLPSLFVNVSSALRLASDLVEHWAVHTDRMRENLAADNGLIMCEAAMISLAPHLGRERAHDLVYDLAGVARTRDVRFETVLGEWMATQRGLPDVSLVVDETAVGEAASISHSAATRWESALKTRPRPWKEL